MGLISKVGLAASTLALLASTAIGAPRTGAIRASYRSEFGISAANTADGPRRLDFQVPDVPQREAYLHPSTMKAMGGVLFLGTAQPKAGLPNACPNLGLNLARPSGQRMTVTFDDGKPYTGHIYDWELIPVMRYVQSDSQGLYSYMGVQAAYHDAFADNLAGINLFLLDSSREWKNFPSAHMFLEHPVVPGYPQAPPSAANRAAWKVLQPWLGYEHLLFIDRGVKFVFYTNGDKFLISGRPYWVAVTEKDEIGTGTIMRSFNDVKTARLSNPTIYDSAYRLAIYSAFFRYMKKDCHTQWNSFYSLVKSKRQNLDEINIKKEDMFDKISGVH